jgi:uncharacterized protein YycO
MIKLQPGDVLMFVQEGNDWKSVIGRWGIGRYGHVAMYLGNAFNVVPVMIESTGGGVEIHSLQYATGDLIKVMRPKAISEIDSIIKVAIDIASDPQSYYDYFCIIKNCLPRVFKEKFPWLPIPLQYHRDAAMICSELVAEIYWKAGINILPKDIVPLPGDFESSPVLADLGEGRIMGTDEVAK